MIESIDFLPATFKKGAITSDARNVEGRMQLKLRLDRRGVQDLISALAATIDGAAAVSYPSHHGDINIEMTDYLIKE